MFFFFRIIGIYWFAEEIISDVVFPVRPYPQEMLPVSMSSMSGAIPPLSGTSSWCGT